MELAVWTDGAEVDRRCPGQASTTVPVCASSTHSVALPPALSSQRWGLGGTEPRKAAQSAQARGPGAIPDPVSKPLL